MPLSGMIARCAEAEFRSEYPEIDRLMSWAVFVFLPASACVPNISVIESLQFELPFYELRYR
jgi:hypothetical protein